MEGSDILQTLAEVAIALTGFTGIVVALRGQESASLAGFAGARFRILLAGSLAALTFSLLPFLLDALGVEGWVVWSSGSAAVAVFMVPIVVADARAFRDHASEIPDFERRAAPVIAVLGACLWFAQIGNALFWHSFGPFLAAPMWFLAFSALAFARLLVAPDIRD